MIEEKIETLGIKLPNPPTPAGSYVPAVRTGNLLYISGQIPMEDGKVIFTGKVSDVCSSGYWTCRVEESHGNEKGEEEDGVM